MSFLRKKIPPSLTKIPDSKDITKETGDTPLHTATRKMNRQLVELLVKAKANINAKNSQGFMPIHLAVQSEDIEITKFLIQNGALLNTEENEQKSDTKLTSSASKIEKTLKETDAELLFKAVESGDVEKVATLIRTNPGLDFQNSSRGSLLTIAIKLGQFSVAEFLEKTGISTDENSLLALGSYAARSGKVQLLTSLMHKQTLAGRNWDQHYTAFLQEAIAHKQLAIIQFLFFKGVKLNSVSIDLEKLLTERHFELALFLIQSSQHWALENLNRLLPTAATQGAEEFIRFVIEKNEHTQQPGYWHCVSAARTNAGISGHLVIFNFLSKIIKSEGEDKNYFQIMPCLLTQIARSPKGAPALQSHFQELLRYNYDKKQYGRCPCKGYENGDVSKCSYPHPLISAAEGGSLEGFKFLWHFTNQEKKRRWIDHTSGEYSAKQYDIPTLCGMRNQNLVLHAVKSGNCELVDFLIKQGCSLKARYTNLDAPYSEEDYRWYGVQCHYDVFDHLPITRNTITKDLKTLNLKMIQFLVSQDVKDLDRSFFNKNLTLAIDLDDSEFARYLLSLFKIKYNNDMSVDLLLIALVNPTRNFEQLRNINLTTSIQTIGDKAMKFLIDVGYPFSPKAIDVLRNTPNFKQLVAMKLQEIKERPVLLQGILAPYLPHYGNQSNVLASLAASYLPLDDKGVSSGELNTLLKVIPEFKM